MGWVVAGGGVAAAGAGTRTGSSLSFWSFFLPSFFLLRSYSAMTFAISSLDGPVAAVAGAGGGETRVAKPRSSRWEGQT